MYALVLFSSAMLSPNQTTTDGWTKHEENWYYLTRDGSVVHSILEIEQKTYCFEEVFQVLRAIKTVMC